MISFETGLLGSNHGGIGREALSSFDSLYEMDPENIVALTWTRQNANVVRSRRIQQVLPRKISLGISLLIRRPLHLRTPRRTDLYLPQVLPFTISKRKGEVLVRLHDLFPITHPEWFTPKAVSLFKVSLNSLIARGAFFIPVSHSTERELMQIFPKANSLGVIHCHIPPLIDSEPCNNCRGCQFDTSKKYFLSVGTIEPRKNYEFLASLAGSVGDATLVVVGRVGWKSQETLELLEGTSGISYLGQICDAALANLYSHAGAFLSPSHEEGFNIPAFEAKRFGLPLLLSDIPVHRELHPDERLISISAKELWIEAIADSRFPKVERNIPTFAEYSERFRALLQKRPSLDGASGRD